MGTAKHDDDDDDEEEKTEYFSDPNEGRKSLPSLLSTESIMHEHFPDC